MESTEKITYSLEQVFGVASALIEHGGKFLLIKEVQRHIPNHPDHGKWNLPGGRIDVGEDPRTAAEREAHEETGYDFSATAILGLYSIVRQDLKKRLGRTPHGLKIIFLGTFEGEPGPLTDDASEVRWFTPQEINNMGPEKLRDIDIQTMVKDFQAGRRFPLELIRHTIRQ